MFGIVFEGGGMKGSYHIGVWEALKHLKLSVNGAVGTSIGAITSALFIQSGGDSSLATRFWKLVNESRKEMSEEEYSLYKKVSTHDFQSIEPQEIKKEMRQVFQCDGLDLSFFKESINSVLDENHIRNSGKDLGLVTISLSRNMGVELFLEDIPPGQLADYIVASCCFPTFKEIYLNGEYYTDGIYFNRLPTNMLINKGYKNIIEVVLYPSRNRTRALEIPPDVNIIRIEASDYLGRALEFDHEKFLSNMELGYQDAMKSLKHL
ncbi:MAG: patatin-like phospholipase family protein [Peptostreptococcales bacterium]